MLHLDQLDHLTITVSDVSRSVRFYQEMLGLHPEWEWPGEITMLRCGPTFIAIAHWAQGKTQGCAPAITVDHFAFRVTRKGFEEARATLPSQGVPLEGVSDHGICHSLYFRDPDGHQIELACYEMEGHPDRMPRRI